MLIIRKKLKYRLMKKITNMKKAIYLSFSLLAIFSLIAVAPSAFAEHGEGGMACLLYTSDAADE